MNECEECERMDCIERGCIAPINKRFLNPKKSVDWDSYFLTLAETVSTKSKDNSSQIGCVIVGPQHEIRTTGYNGFCRGVDDNVDERHMRPEKYYWAEHAERNAIYNAARNGIQLEGCTAYISGNSGGLPPCADCTRALIQSGIKKIVIDEAIQTNNAKWIESWLRSKIMLKETGVDLVQHKKN